MEMIWSGSPKNLGKDAQLFTSVLFNVSLILILIKVFLKTLNFQNSNYVFN